MKQKNIMTLILGSALIAALMTGCGAKKAPAETTPAAVETTTAAEATEAVEEKKFHIDSEDLD